MSRFRFELYLHYAEVSGQTSCPDRFTPGNIASVATEQVPVWAADTVRCHTAATRVIGRAALSQRQYL